MDQVVAHPRPLRAHRRSADVVRHAGRTRRKDRHVGATLALEFQLRLFQALPDLVVADAEVGGGRAARRIRQARQLAVAEQLELARRRGVVPVAIDDHGGPLRLDAGAAWTGAREPVKLAHLSPLAAACGERRYSALTPENLTALPHRSASAAMKAPHSAPLPVIGVASSSAKRARIFASMRPALISRLSFSMISGGVPLGAPKPYQ